MIPVLVFVAVFTGSLGLYFGVTALRDSPAKKLRRRLQGLENSDQETVASGAADRLLREANSREQAVFQLPLLRGIKKLIEHSGTSVKPSLFVLFVFLTVAPVVGAVHLWCGNLLLALAAGSATGYLPVLYLRRRKKRRQEKFAEQLPEALTMIARSLRAGHSLAAAVELIGQELPQPAGGLFRNAFEQQQLGMRMTDALSAMTGKIDSIDLHFFVTIVRVNSESGGSLAEILEKLAETIRSRLQIRRQVQTYTAEGRFSALVLLVLPAVVFAIFHLKNPKYMEVFFTVPVCQLSLVAAALAQVVGFLMMRKIIDIRI